ncbi:MAG: O-antigen ligase family protein [Planctomycetes bacterium]|nr:O-antigen ligase family protein [Planctomycetota bacterium]
MAATPHQDGINADAVRLRRHYSRAALALALLLLAATYLLISPPADTGYPGAKPWRDFSVLRSLTEVMSLGGHLRTHRGTEIKDFAFHLAAAAGLVLLALRTVVAQNLTRPRPTLKGAWFYAQVLLAGWVALSFVSATWSGDAALSLSQSALYALALAWAIALAWTLDEHHLPHLLIGFVAIAAVGATLCIWYHWERNPYHRPGFPIGNPGPLGACFAAAILIAVCTLLAAGRRWRQARKLPFEWPFVAVAAAALIPLIWCFVLTYSRAAMIGLLVGLLALVFLRAGRRTRWSISLVAVVLFVVLGWWMYTQRLDQSMARGSTLRFRFYAWRYATELWMQRPISGGGAAAYTRFSGTLAARDRELDPAAFMGDWIAHAHNEMFEVFAEIGLMGGVTFVGGFVAALIAAAALLRSNLTYERRWLLIGLIAALVALLTDLMFSVGLRLAGMPAVFYTLLGVLWAACRSDAQGSELTDTLATVAARGGPALRQPSLPRVAVATLAVLGALLAGGLALRNWSGVLHEQAAYTALAEERHSPALLHAQLAEQRLLEPVRKLFANERAVRARLGLAQAAHQRLFEQSLATSQTASASQPVSAPQAVTLSEVIELYSAAYLAAGQLDQRAPTLQRMPAVAARCAERLADLNRSVNANLAQQWIQRAWRAWVRQRDINRFDVEALLALAEWPGYPIPLSDKVGMLRDALRHGFPNAQWVTVLQQLDGQRGFAEVLERYVRAVGPINPQTEIDLLVASRAPETCRLAAQWHGLHGDFAAAERYAGQAALLYDPMRARFTRLFSVALAEQAEYALRATPLEPGRAVALSRAALEALPIIQQQKYAQMAAEYRLRLARYLLANGEEDAARAALQLAVGDTAPFEQRLADMYVWLAQTFVRLAADKRPPIADWLAAAIRLEPRHLRAWGWRAWTAAETNDPAAVETVLAQARQAGLSREQLDQIARSLRQEFPELELSGMTAEPESQPAPDGNEG